MYIRFIEKTNFISNFQIILLLRVAKQSIITSNSHQNQRNSKRYLNIKMISVSRNYLISNYYSVPTKYIIINYKKLIEAYTKANSNKLSSSYLKHYNILSVHTKYPINSS